MDGRTVPQRAVDVLAGLKADVIALQAALFAALEGQLVLGMMRDRDAAEDRVAELVAAQQTSR